MMQNHFNQEFKLSKTSARVLLCFNYFFSHLSQFLSSILGNCMRTLGSYGISSNNWLSWNRTRRGLIFALSPSALKFISPSSNNVLDCHNYNKPQLLTKLIIDVRYLFDCRFTHSIRDTLTPFRMGFFGAAHGEEVPERPPSLSYNDVYS